MLTKFNKIFCKSVYLLNVLVYYDKNYREKILSANIKKTGIVTFTFHSNHSLAQCFLPMYNHNISGELYYTFLFNQENLFFGFKTDSYDRMETKNFIGNFNLLWFYNKIVKIKNSL